jgi:hypothetical protein
MTTEARAQSLVLQSLLEGIALPGTGQPIVFPDLATYPDARLVVIADPDDWQVGDLPAGVEVIAPAEARMAASPERPALLFEFLPPEPRPDQVGVRLRISVTSGDGEPWPLGEVIAAFSSDEPTRAVDQPRALAF